MKTLTTTIIVLLLFPIFGIGQKTIKAKKLRQDFDKMTKSIEAHPDPYRYLSQDEFESLADSLRNLITEPMDATGYYKICAPLIHSIKDGHTSLRLPQNHIKNHMKEVGAFPYKVHLNDEEKMFVIKNYGEDETIPLGSQLLSINCVGISDFIKQIDSYTFYERKSFRNSQIESRMNTLLYLHFGSFTQLEIEYYSDAAKTHTVDNIEYKTYESNIKEENKDLADLIRNGKPYEYKKITKGVGLIKIHSFLIVDEVKFERFLKKTFKNIKEDGITSLILDVRGNLGGFPRASAEIYHYLTDLPFKTMAISNMKISHTYRNLYRDQNPHVNFNAIPFTRQGYSVDLYTLFNGEVGSLATEVNSNNELPKKMENEFSGDLYLLTDRTSFSAASSFAATFRCYALGIIVGEPTGGTKVFFGNSIPVKLKHSKLTIGIGTVKNYTTCFADDENEAIVPDVKVSPSVLDLINNSDQMLYYTLNLIKKIKRSRETK